MKNSVYILPFVICIIILTFMPEAFAATYGDDWDYKQITDNSVSDYRVSVHNGNVAWQNNQGVHYWDGASITTIDSGGSYASLYNGQMAYLAGNEVMFWDGSSTQQISNVMYAGAPSLYDGKIAYTDNDWGGVKYWDGSTTTTITNDYASEVSLHNGTIAYQSSDPTGENEIYYWDGSTIVNVSNDPSNSDVEPSLNNGQISWTKGSGDTDIAFWDGSTTTILTQPNGSVDKWTALDDGNVVWTGSNVFHWDGTETNSVYPSNGTWPSIHDGQVAFSAWDGSDYEIFLATNPEYYITSMVDAYALPYTSMDIQALVDLYMAKDEAATPVIGGKYWSYTSGTLPGDDGSMNIGDMWTDSGNYYLKLGSGIFSSNTGPTVPEFPIAAVPFVMGFIGMAVRRIRG